MSNNKIRNKKIKTEDEISINKGAIMKFCMVNMNLEEGKEKR
jgi:hypothetical protein